MIYDIIGREVAKVADADYPAGYTELVWNGINKNGNSVSSGVYFYRVSTGNWSKVKKMMMLKRQNHSGRNLSVFIKVNEPSR